MVGKIEKNSKVTSKIKGSIQNTIHKLITEEKPERLPAVSKILPTSRDIKIGKPYSKKKGKRSEKNLRKEVIGLASSKQLGGLGKYLENFKITEFSYRPPREYSCHLE